VTVTRWAQFSTTVKIPDAEYRQESEKTLITLLSWRETSSGAVDVRPTIAGLILPTRKGHFPWRAGPRLTLALSFIPIADATLRFWQSQSHYDTTVQWQTFLTGDLTGTGVRWAATSASSFSRVLGLLLVFPSPSSWGAARRGPASAAAPPWPRSQPWPCSWDATS